ncbi:uncharacterized protein [Pyrus communis]|uniref:uncharacterized protein isoform X2 n=1 Tax=Pyrus communis TaxID=23211 RepID=UPI0035BFB44E
MRTWESKISMLEEGLEISQPALDPDNSELHHLLTARDNRTEVHRNINNALRGGRKCDENSTDPSCTGFVEMMAPVNSRASWRCIWHIIQQSFTGRLNQKYRNC